MNLILLPGNTDKTWIKEIQRNISPLFKSSFLVEYAHHHKGETIINFEYELDSLNKLILDNKLSDYIIFAKSAGTLLTVKGANEEILKPQKCIFLGLPINWAYKHKFDIDTWIQNYSIPTLFIQQTNDPYYSYKELQTYLHKHSVENFLMHEIEGNNHYYSNLEEIKEQVKNYI